MLQVDWMVSIPKGGRNLLRNLEVGETLKHATRLVMSTVTTLPKTHTHFSPLKMMGFQVRNLQTSRGLYPFSGAFAVSFRGWKNILFLRFDHISLGKPPKPHTSGVSGFPGPPRRINVGFLASRRPGIQAPEIS